MSKASAILLGVLLLPFCAIGGTADDDIQETVITASRLATPAAQVTSSVTVIPEEEITRSGKKLVSELLRTVPGVTLVSRGGPGQLTYASLRGLEEEQTLVLIDGIKLNDPSDPSRAFDLGNLDLSQVERIEIVRGAQSVVHGSEAMGGVIQIFTRKPGGNLPQWRIGGSGGTYGTASSRLSVRGTAAAGLAFSLGIDASKTAGYSAALDPSPAADRDGKSIQTLSIGLRQPIATGTEASLTARLGYSKTDADAGAYQDGPGVIRSRSLVSRLEASHQLSPLSRLVLGQELSMGLRSYDQFAETFGPYSSKRLRTDLRATTWFGDALELHWLGELDQESASFSDRPPVVQDFSARTLSMAVEARRDSERFFGSAGLRLDHHGDFGNFLTFKLAPGMAIGPGVALKGSIGTGFKSPSLYQLHSTADYGQGAYGNPLLGPEKSVSLDIGISWSAASKTHSGSLAFFENRVRDQIDGSSAPYRNLGRTLTRGLEWSAMQELGRASLRASATHLLVARNELTGEPLPQRPPLQLAIVPALKVSENARMEGGLRLAGHPAYAVTDLSAQWIPRPGWTLQMQLGNLLDRSYEEVPGYATPGRTLTVGAEIALH